MDPSIYNLRDMDPSCVVDPDLRVYERETCAKSSVPLAPRGLVGGRLVESSSW